LQIKRIYQAGIGRKEEIMYYGNYLLRAVKKLTQYFTKEGTHLSKNPKRKEREKE